MNTLDMMNQLVKLLPPSERFHGHRIAIGRTAFGELEIIFSAFRREKLYQRRDTIRNDAEASDTKLHNYFVERAASNIRITDRKERR
jgi:hypothetical protein